MKITIESTTKVVELHSDNGLTPARIWEGETDSGVKVVCFVTRIAVQDDPQNPQDTTQFERELLTCRAPSEPVKSIPLRMIL